MGSRSGCSNGSLLLSELWAWPLKLTLGQSVTLSLVMFGGASGPRQSVPTQRKPKPAARAKERDGACKRRKPQARKNRPWRRATSALGCHQERAVLPPASPPLVMWKVYEHPKDYPGEYVARKFVITGDFYGPSNESISSRSLRDVQNLLRNLYRGLIQLQLSPDDEPHVVEIWL
jgi:hypothetical protein